MPLARVEYQWKWRLAVMPLLVLAGGGYMAATAPGGHESEMPVAAAPGLQAVAPSVASPVVVDDGLPIWRGLKAAAAAKEKIMVDWLAGQVQAGRITAAPQESGGALTATRESGAVRPPRALYRRAAADAGYDGRRRKPHSLAYQLEAADGETLTEREEAASPALAMVIEQPAVDDSAPPDAMRAENTIAAAEGEAREKPGVRIDAAAFSIFQSEILNSSREVNWRVGEGVSISGMIDNGGVFSRRNLPEGLASPITGAGAGIRLDLPLLDSQNASLDISSHYVVPASEVMRGRMAGSFGQDNAWLISGALRIRF